MMMRQVTAKTFALLTLLILPVLAEATVGRVLFTHGAVSIERPQPDVLTKGMRVDEGEIIVTGANGYVQLLLDDATKVAIRPDSRFAIDALEMPAGNGFGAIGGGVTPQTRFSLQKGGFRTLTGRIASMQPSAYQVSTPNAVVGVRGTNYIARLCAGDCGPGTDNGLFVGVSDGSVFLSNDAGELDLLTNQFGYAANFTTQPVRLIAPPPTLRDEGLDLVLEEEEEEEGDAEATAAQGDDEGESADEDAEEVASEFAGEADTATTDTADTSTTTGATGQPEQEITAVTADGSAIDLTGGGNTPSQLFSFSADLFALGSRAASGSLTIDDEGNLSAFQALGSSGATESWEIGTAIPHNNGFDPETALRWGRWSEGVAILDGADVNLTSASLHYVLAPEQEVPAQVISGTAEYLLVGNTDPTDNAGNIGVLGSASLLANFTNATVTSDLELGINGQVWAASGTGAINSNLFSGLYSTVSVDTLPGGSGSFGGFFTGFSAGAPLGAGLNYNLTNGSTTVNGAAVFNQAP